MRFNHQNGAQLHQVSLPDENSQANRSHYSAERAGESGSSDQMIKELSDISFVEAQSQNGGIQVGGNL